MRQANQLKSTPFQLGPEPGAGPTEFGPGVIDPPVCLMVKRQTFSP